MLFKGIGVSTGVARGTAFVLAPTSQQLPIARRDLGDSDVALELQRLDGALARTDAELASLEERLTTKLSAAEAAIFGAQRMIVRSSHLVDSVRELVRQKRVNVEAAVASVLEQLVGAFDALSDPIVRDRAADIRDVGKRLLSLLIAQQSEGTAAIPEGSIVIADELLPSITAHFDLQHVGAMVTERGGRSSHSSILARAQGIAAVAGIEGATTRIKTGDPVIVDGVAGVVYVHPDATVQKEYDRVSAEIRAHRAELQHLLNLPSVTLDGVHIPLCANVNKLADTESAFHSNAEGIGLYRTEFGFFIRPELPTEDEQYEFLERAAARMHPRPITFRLLDIGGDKQLPTLPLPASRNPSLAQRGIRLLLEHPALLRSQLRAFLRVSADHPVSILLPVVGGLEEVRRTRALVREAQEELRARGQRFDPATPVGAMIEVPAAALLVPALAREVDFFSLGTNDLVQYLLAVDREDEDVASYYQPLHPSVLRIIYSIAQAADAAGRELTICGEMGGNPANVALLLGLGLRRFSVAPGRLLEVKDAIRHARIDAAQELAQRALALSTVDEIEALVAGR
jgi:phosphoenolpyruvate-protein phosphotransferase (PTS system enzyme I)